MENAPSSIAEAKAELFSELGPQLDRIASAARSGLESPSAALHSVALLKPLYEHVNQAHHKALCIVALETLVARHPGLIWRWNPTNKGRGTEADLEGRAITGSLVVAVECSASIDARGTSGQRMKTTLDKLASMDATSRYYFTATEQLYQSALRRVTTYSLPVVVVLVTL